MNKFFVTSTIILCVGLIVGVTTYKVMKVHNEKILLVQKKYIIENAKLCWNEKKCTGDKVTLSDLYKYDYMTTQINKVTKEIIKDSSYVKRNNTSYEFVLES